jgi:hypothetical protein
MEAATYALTDLREAVYTARQLIRGGFDDLIDIDKLHELEREIYKRSKNIRERDVRVIEDM